MDQLEVVKTQLEDKKTPFGKRREILVKSPVRISHKVYLAEVFFDALTEEERSSHQKEIDSLKKLVDYWKSRCENSNN